MQHCVGNGPRIPEKCFRRRGHGFYHEKTEYRPDQNPFLPAASFPVSLIEKANQTANCHIQKKQDASQHEHRCEKGKSFSEHTRIKYIQKAYRITTDPGLIGFDHIGKSIGNDIPDSAAFCNHLVHFLAHGIIIRRQNIVPANIEKWKYTSQKK